MLLCVILIAVCVAINITVAFDDNMKPAKKVSLLFISLLGLMVVVGMYFGSKYSGAPL